MNTAVQFHAHLVPYLRDIASIRPHPQNPNEGDVEAIAESMLVNGVYKGVTVQKSTGYIIEGEHRYLALLSLGATQIPVFEDDVSDAKALRQILADNATAARAERIPDRLQSAMLSVIEDQDSLAGTGYERHDLAELNRMLRVAEHAPLKVEAPEEPRLVRALITIVGFVDDDGETRALKISDLKDTVANLRAIGYDARGETEVG